MAAARNTGDRSLMISGEITRTGRLPPWSEPVTGSSRTRRTSPRRGVRASATSILDSSVSGIVGRLPFPIDLAIEIPHFATSFNDVHAQGIAPLVLKKLFDQISDYETPLPGFD